MTRSTLPHASQSRALPAPAKRLLPALLIVLAITAVGCSQGPSPTTHPLRAVVGQKLVALDASHGVAAEILTSPDLRDLGAMTYAEECECFYAVVAASSTPMLVKLDPRTGTTERLTRLALPRLRLTRVEALAWNPQEGLLYAAGGVSEFLSNHLLSIDPETHKVRNLGAIEGTVQGEADALAYADGRLFAIDSAAQSSRLYSLSLRPAKVQATLLGEAFAGTVIDMEYDPERQVVMAVEESGRLLTLDLEGRLQSENSSETTDAAPLAAVALVRGQHLVPTQIFVNGFESGTLSLWSTHEQKKP